MCAGSVTERLLRRIARCDRLLFPFHVPRRGEVGRAGEFENHDARAGAVETAGFCLLVCCLFRAFRRLGT